MDRSFIHSLACRSMKRANTEEGSSKEEGEAKRPRIEEDEKASGVDVLIF